MPIALLFLLRIVIAIHGFWCFHMIFNIVCTISVKTYFGILKEIVFNLLCVQSIVIMAILAILISLINEHWRFFHLLFSSISFLQCFAIFTFLLLFYHVYITYMCIHSLCQLPHHPQCPSSRQNLFHPLVLCWKENIRDNKTDISFLLVWDKDSYTERFLALLSSTHVLQPTLVHFH
jgi:hypothetical protein